MSGAPSQSFQLFREAFLSSATGEVARTNSHLVRVSGNAVMIRGLVRQASGTAPILTLQGEGSYDGVVWKVVGSAVTIDPTSNPVIEGISSTPISTDHPYFRLRASLATSHTNNQLLFDAEIVVSRQ